MQKGAAAVLLMLAVALGLLIAWVDSRPGWDDTGVTVGTVLLAAAFFSALQPRRPWRWALAVGAWVPIFEIIQGGSCGSLVALAAALIGASLGVFARKIVAFAPKKGNRL